MRWLSTLSIGFPTGLALYAITSLLVLRAGGALPQYLFEVCIAVGLFAGTLIPTPGLDGERRPHSFALPARFQASMPWFASSLLIIAAGLMIYGATSSIPRDWDGFVSWSLKARYLAPPVSLDQPHFTDPAIYAYGLTYPPLQPLCLGAMQDLLGDLAGQLLFPTLYVASIATVFLALTGHGMGPTGAWLGTLAFGLTPMLLNPGAGAVDSGYAEMFLIYALLLAGCGLLLADLRFLFLGALLLPLIKPEGTAYAITLGLVTATTACRRHHYATTWGLTCALMLWLPLRSGDHGALSIAGPLLIGGGLCALHELVRRFSRATVLLITSSLAVAMLATIFLAEEALRSSNNFLLRDFVVHVVELGPRLSNTPTLLLGYIKAVVSLNDFGLLFILVLALLLSPKRLVGTTPCRPLAWFLVGGLTLACVAMLLSPDPDLTHVFRSRFDRLLLHWAGPAWLLTSAWVFQAPDPAAQPEPPTYAASAWESSNDPRGSGKQP